MTNKIKFSHILNLTILFVSITSAITFVQFLEISSPSNLLPEGFETPEHLQIGSVQCSENQSKCTLSETNLKVETKDLLGWDEIPDLGGFEVHEPKVLIEKFKLILKGDGENKYGLSMNASNAENFGIYFRSATLAKMYIDGTHVKLNRKENHNFKFLEPSSDKNILLIFNQLPAQLSQIGFGSHHLIVNKLTKPNVWNVAIWFCLLGMLLLISLLLHRHSTSSPANAEHKDVSSQTESKVLELPKRIDYSLLPKGSSLGLSLQLGLVYTPKNNEAVSAAIQLNKDFVETLRNEMEFREDGHNKYPISGTGLPVSQGIGGVSISVLVGFPLPTNKSPYYVAMDLAEDYITHMNNVDMELRSHFGTIAVVITSSVLASIESSHLSSGWINPSDAFSVNAQDERSVFVEADEQASEENSSVIIVCEDVKRNVIDGSEFKPAKIQNSDSSKTGLNTPLFVKEYKTSQLANVFRICG